MTAKLVFLAVGTIFLRHEFGNKGYAMLAVVTVWDTLFTS
jgi:hypothetical protein